MAPHHGLGNLVNSSMGTNSRTEAAKLWTWEAEVSIRPVEEGTYFRDWGHWLAGLLSGLTLKPTHFFQES